MIILADPGGSFHLLWEDLVIMLQSGWDTVVRYSIRLLSLFVTPFEYILYKDSGLSSWFTDALSWFLDLLGVNLLALTPLEFMLGTFIPIIIVFTIYRYFKQ